MRKTWLSLVPAALLLGAVACSDSTSPSSDQADVVASISDQLGAMMDTDFGAAGGVQTEASAPLATNLFLSPMADTALVPPFWGRLRIIPGGPKPILNRTITVQGDTARVSQTVSFQGLFLVDTTRDTTFNPSSKPLNEGMTQSAVFVRDGSQLHHWRAVSLTLQNWLPTSVAARTVAVTNVSVAVNGVVQFTGDNPDSLYSVASHLLRLHVGDTVTVTAAASNGDAAYSPNTFLFLHVHHAFVDFNWHRVPMTNNGDGTWTRSWIVRRTGVDRFVVDAIDAATLELTADNYAANEWAIPYRIQ